MKKSIRYTITGFAILAGIFILLYVAAYIYIVSNKKQIILQIKEQLANKLNGDVQIGDIDIGFLNTFPRISALIKDVSINDTMYRQHHHSFFQAEKIYASLSLIRLVHKDNPLNGIRIEKGQVYFYTDTSGYTNTYLFNPKQNSGSYGKKSESQTEIDEVVLRSSRFILDDRKKNQYFDFDFKKFNCDINTKDSILTLNTNDNILIHSLAFNTKLGSFVKETLLTGRFKLFFNKNQKELYFNDIHLELKDHPFTLTGKFNFSKIQSFLLKVATKNINYNFARSLLADTTAKALSIVKLSKDIDEASAEVSGLLKGGGDPLVKATWKIKDVDVQSSYANFTNCSLNGFFINDLVPGLPRKDANSRLQFRDFVGDWNGLTMHAQNIYIDNLVFPMVNADIASEFDLIKLNSIIGSTTLDLHGGKGSLQMVYSGPLEKNTNRNTLLNGKFSFSDGIVVYHPRNIQLKNVGGNIVFKNSDVFVNDLRLNAEGNKIAMSGSGRNLLALLKTNPGKILLDWNIYSPSLNLGNFTSLLKSRTSTNQRKAAGSAIGKNLDEIVTQANFHLDVKADRLIYKNFTANNVRASLGLVNENWNLYNVSLKHAGGTMVLKGTLTEKSSNLYSADINADMENVDVNKVMYAFNNFGQTGIGSENLRGKLTSDVHAQMDINRETETPSNISGVVNFSLKNGALLNYEPLKKIQSIVFKKRNFDEIYFAELKNTFDIKNNSIIINRMEIASTVIRLFVEGVYGLHGNSDISIQVPLNNLKKRDEDYTPENKGVDAKGGASVYIRGTSGADGSMKFKLDLFKKFRRKDKRDNTDTLQTQLPKPVD